MKTQAAEAFAQAMAGSGTHAENKSHEGKVNILAAIDGMLVVEKERLERFNLFPDIMAASRKSYSLVKKNSIIAGTRAIPLFISADCFQSALAFLQESPLFQVKPITPVKVGILITGTEVFKGLIQDRFEDIIGEKVRRYGCEVVKAKIVPDDRFAIAEAVKELCDLGTKLIVTTAGLSVDPDDVTLKGLQDAGSSGYALWHSCFTGLHDADRPYGRHHELSGFPPVRFILKRQVSIYCSHGFWPAFG